MVFLRTVFEYLLFLPVQHVWPLVTFVMTSSFEAGIHALDIFFFLTLAAVNGVTCFGIDRSKTDRRRSRPTKCPESNKTGNYARKVSGTEVKFARTDAESPWHELSWFLDEWKFPVSTRYTSRVQVRRHTWVALGMIEGRDPTDQARLRGYRIPRDCGIVYIGETENNAGKDQGARPWNSNRSFSDLRRFGACPTDRPLSNLKKSKVYWSRPSLVRT